MAEKQLTVQQDFKRWREMARTYLQNAVIPADARWDLGDQLALPFSFEQPKSAAKTNKHQVPAAFIQVAQFLSQHRDHSKWTLLYQMLWRLTHGEPYLLRLSSDPAVRQLHRMNKAVSRDIHKMKAFVRFNSSSHSGEEHFHAWFEPEHLVLEAVAEFFVKRFTAMNWTVCTPGGCAHWNQKQLRLSEGITYAVYQQMTEDDEMNEYWRQYYRHIFNPARLKEAAMKSEMPKKYWKYLPESVLIPKLTQKATLNMTHMLSQPATDPERLRAKSKKLKQQQNAIRSKNQKQAQ
ncbi:TIGR03915 family putative DNA repair protein [Marinicella marina]|nr:TIGR03915 family putative DNA repair protein [Marinicella marina]MDJ1140019.1 TIGR03915 family putative DNA repair protein [Marinicella marina]